MVHDRNIRYEMMRKDSHFHAATYMHPTYYKSRSTCDHENVL